MTASRQIAVIPAIYFMPQAIQDRARPAIRRRANDRTTGLELRSVAEKALRKALSAPQ